MKTVVQGLGTALVLLGLTQSAFGNEAKRVCDWAEVQTRDESWRINQQRPPEFARLNRLIADDTKYLDGDLARVMQSRELAFKALDSVAEVLTESLDAVDRANEFLKSIIVFNKTLNQIFKNAKVDFASSQDLKLSDQ